MGNTERQPKPGSGEVGENAGAQRTPTIDKSVGGVIDFLRQMKLLVLMRNQDPNSGNFEKLREVEEGLQDKDPKVRAKSQTLADQLIQNFDLVSGEAGRASLQRVVETAYPDAGKRPGQALGLASEIDKKMAEITRKFEQGQAVEAKESEEIFERLSKFRDEVGFRGMTQEGMQIYEDTILTVVAARQVGKNVENPLVYESPLEAKKEFFAEGSSPQADDKRLKIRRAKPEQKPQLEEKLERMKKNVREVVIEKKRKMGGQEAIGALEDISDLKARLRSLVGDQHKETLETLQTLSAAEAHFRRILSDNIEAKLGGGAGVEQGSIYAALGDVLHEARGGRYAGGKARYHFEDKFDKVVETVERRAKSYEAQMSSRFGRAATLGGDEYKGMSQVERMIATAQAQQEAAFHEKVNDIYPVLSEMGIDPTFPDGTFFTKLQKQTVEERIQTIDEVIRQGRERGVSESKLTMGAKFLHSIARAEKDKNGVMVDFLDVKERLRGYVKKHQYGRYIREMKSYVSRVGLRESSADFQFAIMLRDAKDVISILETDVAEEFDAWQGSLFIPSFKSVDPETFRSMFERVWNASNLDHVLNPAYANAAGMLVEMPDGTKKMMSTAVFYQLLQRGDNATRFLNAAVDTVDSTSFRIWIDYLYGKGATWEGDLATGRVVDANGRELAKMNSLIKVQGFDVKSKKLDGDDQDTFTLGELLEQGQWMHRYAENFFMYSGEAGKHMRHYPKEMMENANKWVFAQDQMFEGYSGHYGKYAQPFWQIAKLGHLLREIRGYKDTGIFQEAMVLELRGAGIESDRAIAFSKMWTDKLKQKITVEGKTFDVGLLSIEEIRLIGNEWGGAEEAWLHAKDYLTAHNMPEGMIKDQAYIRRVLGKKNRGEKMSEEEENWAKQAEEFFALCKSLKWSDVKKKDYGGLSERELASSMTERELAVFAKRKNTIFGGEWKPRNMTEFVQGFEYAAVMDPAKFLQGTDPIEYARKYMKLSEDVAKLLPKIELGTATSVDFIEVQKSLRAYLPPDQVDNFVELLLRKSIQVHRYQFLPYEIAKLKDSCREIDYRSMKDENGDSIYFIDRDGHRTAKTEMYHGNYMYDRWKVKAWRDSDVETLMDALHGEAMIPREIGEDILDDLIGGGKVLDKLLGLENKNLSEKQVARRKFVKKVFARVRRLIQRLPLFDDPGWVMFSLGAAYLNFFGEVAGEVAKEAGK